MAQKPAQETEQDFILPPDGKRKSRWGFGGKTVWDWLPIVGAFLVPLVVALGTGWITWQLAKLENQRAEQVQRIENQRAEAERELAEQRAQDEALQAYLDQMSGLLLERDLRASEEDSEVRSLARARTLTVLGRLDPSRKTALMQFLVEADLVQRVDGRDPIISLRDAGLREVDLSGAILSGATLSGANLSGADLSLAYLKGVILFDADLSGAILSGANLSGANLKGAILSGANLKGANLSGADLSLAYLKGVILFDADLSDADLSGAEGITNEELEQQAATLEGATMPNGQKYEEWLKDK